MTTQQNLDTKATAVKDTWAKRCNKYLFFTNVTKPSFPIVNLNLTEGRDHLTAKTVSAFKYCYENYGHQFDWFLKADDDTYVIVENLRFFLSHHNPAQLVYFGHKFKLWVKQGYFSGGAGYVISRRAMNVLVNRGLNNPLMCRQDGFDEDVDIGKCMEKLHITAGDSLDIERKETFHPFLPQAHLAGIHPKWLFKYSFYEPKKVS